MDKHCYSNDYETFVATSVEEAFAIYLEWGWGDIDDDHKIEEWCQCNGDVQHAIFLEDRDPGAVIPTEATIVKKEEWATVYSATYDQWAAANDIGLLSSTEY